ncbi:MULTISPECIES: OmpA family protein [Reichenbachiella]|uniref:Outer membrane protein OmpA n=1 Tax=Reichenbachiella agariperforans TaxID=156994 RepID=A0A1M6L725_REIAG|nr:MULTISPECIES: OmpA family protein [Reichenbachiella]MBU2913814.1 OmpA family protein [Reichenbachiella agariperforans]SHJ66996.1 Outer membrane protein OmpA [Reichenbachiella agariperforans]
MVKVFVLVFFCCFYVGQLHSQNMVINPSFEEIWDCPYTMDQLKYVKSWFPFGTADPSPDFFHGCASDGFMGVPNNMFGEQTAHSGESYVGMICYLTSRSGRGWKVPANHREYVMVQLTKPLVAGNEYYGEFWVNLVDACEFSINNIGMYFTKDMPNFDWQTMNFHHYKAQINSDPDQQLDDNEEWTKVSGTFTAKGGELALTLGTFLPDSSLETKRTKRKFITGRDKNLPKHLQPMIAYYLIDDIIVRPVDPTEPIFPETVAMQPIDIEYYGPAEVGMKFTLQNIYFEFEKATLLRSSLLELNKLKDYLVKHPHIKIQIEGHTDNVGSREINQKLSTERAKSVVEFLIANGISDFRLEYIGHGSSYPIVPNDTPQNRALNRRVEFSILEN